MWKIFGIMKNVVHGEILYTDQPVLLWWQNARNTTIKASNYRNFVQLDLHRSPAETLTLSRCTKPSVQIKNTFLRRRMVTVYISVKLLLSTGKKVKDKISPYNRPRRSRGWAEVYSFTLSWLRRLDGGGWSASRPGCFTPGKDPVPIVQEAG